MNFVDFPSNLLSKLKHKIESKYVELKSLGVHSKMFEIMRKWLENLGKTLNVEEKKQTTLGRGNKQQNIQVSSPHSAAYLFH